MMEIPLGCIDFLNGRLLHNGEYTQQWNEQIKHDHNDPECSI